MCQLGAFPFVISYRAFAGLTRNPAGNRALSFPTGSESEGRERILDMKKSICVIAMASMSLCVGGLTGCRTIGSAIAAFSMKSDIESRCRQFEENYDGAGMKTYLDDLLNTKPKPEGWNDSIEELVNSRLAKARSMISQSKSLKTELESRCKQFEEKNDSEGLRSYLEGLLATNPKPDGWDESVAELVNSLLIKAHSQILKNKIQATYDKYVASRNADKARSFLLQTLADNAKTTGWNKSVEDMVRNLLEDVNGVLLTCYCEKIWAGVKAALDKRDFEAARRLTATAAPCENEQMRAGVLSYRIGILNEIINPYQSDWIIYQMKAKVSELKKAGKDDEVGAYLNSIQMIKDDIPCIEQKVREIKLGLKNLYWLDDRIQDYLQKNIAEIQTMLDARIVPGEYRSYKEIHAMIDSAVSEMKLYTPVWGEHEAQWEGAMRSVRRVMTTAEANAAIAAAKESLTK